MDKKILREAKKLVNGFEPFVAIDYRYDESPIYDFQKACALIVVDMMIRENKSLLAYATTHMDNRATLVIHDRMKQLEALKEAIQSL